MTPTHRESFSLGHHVEVNSATQYLLHELDCDGWHAVCRHEHQLVIQLTRGGLARFCLSYECSPPTEKAVYHGSRAWALAITPMHGGSNLSPEKLTELKAGLGQLHG